MKYLLLLFLFIPSLICAQTYSGRRYGNGTGYSDVSVTLLDYQCATPYGGWVSFSYKYKINPTSSTAMTASATITNFTIFSISGNLNNNVRSGAGSFTATGGPSPAAPIVWNVVSPTHVRLSINVNLVSYDIIVPRDKLAQKKKFYINLSGGDFGTTYYLTQNGQVIGEKTVAAGESESGSWESWDDSEVKIYRKPNVFGQDTDGSWVVAPADTGVEVGTLDSGLEYPAEEPFTGIEPDSNVPPGYDPQNPGVVFRDNGGTSPNLDSVTYKQGVEKIVQAIKDSPGGGGTINVAIDQTPVVNAIKAVGAAVGVGQPTPPAAEFAATAINRTPEQAKVFARGAVLPSAPSIIAPSSTPTSFALNFAAAGHNIHFESDLADFSVPVAIFRAICSAVMSIYFFIAVVKVVRGSVAG